MTVLFAVLDGVAFGCSVALLPAAVQDTLEVSSSDSASTPTGRVLLALMCCTVLFNVGKALTAFFNTISLTKSSVVSLILTSACLICFAFTSTVGWLFGFRLVLGLLSGYLGYFFELDRASRITRSAWLLAAGLTALCTSVLYASDNHQTQPLYHSSNFFHKHPLFASFLFLAAGIHVFFVFFVFSEKYGFIDDEDERTVSSYMPINSSGTVLDSNSLLLELEDGREGGKGNAVCSTEVVVCGPNSTESDDENLGIADLQVPGRFMRGCQGDRTEALRRWRETLAWRRDQKVDSILSEPQPHFFAIKKCYPHFLHNKSVPGNHVMYFEQLGKIDLESLRQQGITVSHLLRHYIFMAEYLWTHVEPDFEHGKSITVLDVSGVGVGDLVGDALDFLKESTKIIQSHYVERSQKIFVVNASYMFSWLWRLVQPMINESTRKKISILSTDMSELVEYVGAATLPQQYGGHVGSTILGQSEEEKQLAMFVNKLNNQEMRDNDIKLSGASGNTTANYGTVIVPSDTPSASSVESVSTPRSLSRVANSRRRKMRSSVRKKGGYNNLKNTDDISNMECDYDKNELGYSSSDGSGGEDDSDDFTDPTDDSSFKTTLMPNFVSNFYDISVRSLKRAVFRDDDLNENNMQTAYLGKENKFIFKEGQWMDESKILKRRKKALHGESKKTFNHNEAKKGLTGQREGEDDGEESCDDTAIIRAIHASQGYYSEDGCESEDISEHSERPQRRKVSLTRRLRRSFRRHISRKKQEALSRVSWWNWLHWGWRAALYISLESIPPLLLLDALHSGLGAPPYILGGCVFICSLLLWCTQSFFIRPLHKPSPGFFSRSLFLSLFLEGLSLMSVIILHASFDGGTDMWSIGAMSPTKIVLLVCVVGFVLASLLFSLAITTLFTASVMTSYKSPLHTPFSRSKAYLADAIGGVTGLLLYLTAHELGWSPLITLIAILAVTTGVHLSIAIFNYLNPHAAGQGIKLQTLQW